MVIKPKLQISNSNQPFLERASSIVWTRFIVAFLIPGMAALFRLGLLKELGDRAAYITFYPAVILAALYGGFPAGIVATIVSALLADYFWIAPKYSLVISDSADMLSMGVFILSCVMVSMVSEAMLRAQDRLRQRTEELAIATDQAQAASQAKSLFLANMSHELRTPLNAILGYTQLMQRDVEVSPKHREYIQIVNRSGEHLLGLINDVLEMTKIESRHSVLEPVTFELNGFFKDIADLFQARTQARGLKFCIDGIDDTTRIVYADAVKLRIVLINLLGNSMKYTEKGYILLRFSMEAADRLSVSVEDTGEGISEDEMGKLFRVFEQTDSGRRLGAGTGLGLAISREYVRLMGGEISVSSRVGEGSVFRFSIKIAEGRKGDLVPTSVKQVTGLESGQKKYRILIAEDTADSRRLLETLLKMIGFEVWTVSDGAEAVKVFETWHPHLIWMDIRMPVMDGLEATGRIRELPGGKECIIVALTAHSLNQEKEFILASGCDDFIRKPYRDKEIFDCMERHLGVRYRYGNESDEAESDAIGVLNPERIKAWDSEWADRLYDSVVALDQKQTLAVIEEIERKDPENGRLLRLMAERLDYTQIMTLLENLKTEVIDQ